jgi:hypothetical protein
MSVRGLTAAGAVLPRPPARTSCAAYSCPVRAPHTRAAQHATTRPAGATCFSQVFVLWRPAVVCAKVLHWSSLVFFGCDSKPRQSKPQLVVVRLFKKVWEILSGKFSWYQFSPGLLHPDTFCDFPLPLRFSVRLLRGFGRT